MSPSAAASNLRPDFSGTDASFDSSIPLVSLQGVSGSGRQELVEAIGSACRSDGFFQIENHEIAEDLIDEIMRIAREPERLKSYSNEPSTRLSTSFNVSTEKVSNWRDYLRLHCYPLEDFVHDSASNPASFREIAGEYAKKMREMGVLLLEAITESLGLKKDHIVKALCKEGQHMAVNYYPRCPQPELTYGLPGHKDPNAITILLQDKVSGLQVIRNGKWVAVRPIPNNFIVNIGDQIQVQINPDTPEAGGDSCGNFDEEAAAETAVQDTREDFLKIAALILGISSSSLYGLLSANHGITTTVARLLFKLLGCTLAMVHLCGWAMMALLLSFSRGNHCMLKTVCAVASGLLLLSAVFVFVLLLRTP